MSESRVSRIVVVLVLVLSAFAGLLFVPLPAQAATWTQTSDSDFNADTLNGVEVVGTGTPAYVQLARDAADWKNESPAADPGARESPAMTFDSTNGVAVLFGGYSSAYLGDTWEYDPAANDWTMTSSTGPSARSDAGMAFDSTSNVVVLFGGITDTGYANDTWEYNAATNSWTNTTPTFSPPALGSYALTYDSAAHRNVLVGLDFVSLTMVTWSYDASTNTWQNKAPSTKATPRTNHAVAYHPGLGRLVLFGGFNPFPPPGNSLGDTWEYNFVGNSWTQTLPTGSGPSARFSHGLGYRGTDSSIFLFGGSGGGGFLDDTWHYFDNSGTRTWMNVFTQTTPPSRSAFGLTDEMPNGKLAMFGGRRPGGVDASDTWSLGPAFRGQGNLESLTFDSTGANVDWQTVSWLPTSQPAGTTLKFQIASNNDPAGPWTFQGPDGSQASFYTSSGATIFAGQDLKRYLRYRAYMISPDDTTSPTLDEITITYNVPAAAPYIVTESPTGAGVPQDSVIFMRFSEAMDITTTSATISPTLSVTPNWSEGNSALTLTHSALMRECTAYTVTVTGKDVDGNNLAPGPVPNPWSFTTQCINPKITSTSPAQGDIDVPLNGAIVVDFSEAMDRTTVTWSASPTVALSGSWSNGDTRLTLTHTTNFLQCTVYTVTIDGKDLVGLPLVPGSVPNPWSFTALCTIPFIVSTIPADQQIDVALSQPIVVTFSETMNNATVQWSISPLVPLTPAWSNANKTLTLTHSALTACTAYTVDITRGKDMQGNDLMLGRYDGYAPHPWKFETACPNPFITATAPADRDTGVDQFAEINVVFSKTMDTTSVNWTILPFIGLSGRWAPGSSNTVLILNHTQPFGCGTNTVQIRGKDGGGNDLVTGLVPNPWSFSPSCPNPYILSTSPADMDTNVPVNAAIQVSFNKPMDVTNVTVTVVPSIIITCTWDPNGTLLTCTHSAAFDENRQYTVIVDGSDVAGHPLIPGPVPNPWRFTTAAVAPYIVSTNPANGATNVLTTASVVVTFSEPMDTNTVIANSIPVLGLNSFWSNNNMTLTLIPPSLFAECTSYQFSISGNDLQGQQLVPGPVPNPWSFSIVCNRPYIVSTSPADGASGIATTASILVTFSAPMNTPTVTAAILPVVTLTKSWANGNQTLTLVPSPSLQPCTMYTVQIAGKGANGLDLTSGPVPNPWSFNTVCTLTAPGGLRAQRVSPNFVHLLWNAVPNADSYHVYESRDRFAAWPWTVLATTTATTYDTPVLLDGFSHYYIVRAVRSALEGPNSTMAAKVQLVIGFNPSSANVHWFSLPYRSEYTRASDVANDLTASRVNVVAKWDPLKQTSVLWYLFRGVWRGTDFTIGPGDGLWIGSLSAFSWSIVGTDRPVSLVFTLNPSPSNNVNWISLPYTSSYRSASDIVLDLEGSLGPGANTKIIEVAKWDGTTQTLVRFYWTTTGWTGSNFSIASGEGVYLKIVASFAWQPKLITPEVP